MRLAFRNEYAVDWSELAAAVKAAAGNRCVRCGHPNGDRVMRGPAEPVLEGRGVMYRYTNLLQECTEHCTHATDGKLRVLTVHHLDGDKANSRWWNLLALCQVCHLQIQARVIPERPYLFEHTAWFKPYVAGFYAWYHGGREISRAEAEAELDRWLALGQPWLYPYTDPTGPKVHP